MMRFVISTIFLIIIWLLLTGEFTLGNLILGSVIGLLIVWMIQRKSSNGTMKKDRILKKIVSKSWSAVTLMFYFTKEAIMATFKVAYDVLIIGKGIEPGIIGYKIDGSSESELVFLSNLITLTPGNLVLDFEEDKKILYVHLINGHREERFRKSTGILYNKIKKILC